MSEIKMFTPSLIWKGAIQYLISCPH